MLKIHILQHNTIYTCICMVIFYIAKRYCIHICKRFEYWHFSKNTFGHWSSGHQVASNFISNGIRRRIVTCHLKVVFLFLCYIGKIKMLKNNTSNVLCSLEVIRIFLSDRKFNHNPESNEDIHWTCIEPKNRPLNL